MVQPYQVMPPCVSLPSELYEQLPFSLGDRVIIAANDRPVPFGEQGTIVTIVGDLLDIILDKEWIGATDLGGRFQSHFFFFLFFDSFKMFFFFFKQKGVRE